ncbi:MAG: hypothetical protein ACWGO1_10575 [Anaerolineales bacterium]
MNSVTRLTLLRACLAVSAFLTAAAWLNFTARTYQAELLFTSRRYIAFAAALGLVGLLEAGILAATWTPLKTRLLDGLASVLTYLRGLGRINLLLLGVLLVAFTYLTVASPVSYLNSTYFRILIYWLAVLGCSTLLWSYGLRRSFCELFAASLMLVAVVYKVTVYLPEITNFPLTLGWSEASRYYYASLYFSRQIYGIDVPPTVLHPSRYLMQAIPFLIPGSPIWLHRLWQILLWLGVTFASAYLLTRRLSISDVLKRWIFIAWSFLFLLIGPVYYHLQVILIIVLLGYSRRSSWKTLAAVIIASLWAGISRINWFPVPGMLAATLYFLEEPAAGRSLWKYSLKPVLWVGVGILTAFASQYLYALVSGNPIEQFTSSFSSELLWYRLFPNPTYPMGVLPDLLLVTAPLLWVIYSSLKDNWRSWHLIRAAGVSAILLVLLAGGLVVSTKIGGGSNLHNLDAFLTLLLVVSAWIYFARAVPDANLDRASTPGQPAANLHWSVLLFILSVPVYFTIFLGPVTPPADQSRLDKALEAIRSGAQMARQTDKDVLLISERQLITFGMLDGVPLVPDYEKVFLMEMAMAGNPEYLGRFHQDLREQRFDLIVSEPLAVRYKGSDKSFGEENDAWVRNVAEPVLCYYEAFRTFRELKIQLLKPRSHPESCPQFSGG